MRIWLYAIGIVLGLLCPVIRPALAQDDLERIKSLIDAIRTRGEPITPDELNQQFAVKKGEEDVSKLWIEGMHLVDVKAFEDVYGELPVYGNLEEEAYPKPGERRPVLELGAKFVESQSAALAKLHEAAKRGGYAYFPLEINKELKWESSLKEDWRLRPVSDLLHYDFEVKLRKNDPRGAAKSLAALLAMPLAFEAQAGIFFIAHEQFTAVHGYLLAKHIHHIAFTDEELLDFQKRIRRLSPIRRLTYSLQLGRMSLVQQYAPVGDLRLLATAPNASIEEFADFLEAKEKLIAAAKRPFPSALEEGKKVHERFKMKWEMRQDGYPLLPFIEIDFGGIDVCALEMLFIHAADAGIACELYHRKHKKLPDTLDQLVPQFLPAVPLDPFNGKPMRTRFDANGLTIYSVGRNGRDDGGNLNKPENGDFGLLFLTKQRKF